MTTTKTFDTSTRQRQEMALSSFGQGLDMLRERKLNGSGLAGFNLLDAEHRPSDESVREYAVEHGFEVERIDIYPGAKHGHVAVDVIVHQLAA